MSQVETIKSNIEHLTERIQLCERAIDNAATAELEEAEERRAEEYRAARRQEMVAYYQTTGEAMPKWLA